MIDSVNGGTKHPPHAGGIQHSVMRVDVFWELILFILLNELLITLAFVSEDFCKDKQIVSVQRMSMYSEKPPHKTLFTLFWMD